MRPWQEWLVILIAFGAAATVVVLSLWTCAQVLLGP